MHRFIFILLCIVLMGCGPKSEKPSGKRFTVFDSSKITCYSTDELLVFLTESYTRWHTEYGKETEMPFIVIHELAQREDDIAVILNSFRHPTDSLQQSGLAEALYQIDDDHVLEAFGQYPANDESRLSYLCLDYRARHGDTEALRVLNENYCNFRVSSLEWAYTVRLFGKFKYRPAVPNLIGSLDAAILNLSDAAYESLRQIFPGPHPELKTIGEAKRYFQKLYDDTRLDQEP